MAHPETKDRLATRLSQSGGRVKISTALNPSLWLCAFVGGPCLTILGVSSDPPVVVTVVLCTVVGLPAIGFLFLLIFDRDRLHSENYLIRKQTLELIEEKGSDKAVVAATIKAISSDEFLQLPEGEDSE